MEDVIFYIFFVFKVPCLLLNNLRTDVLVNLAIVSRNPEAGKSSKAVLSKQRKG